MEHHRAYQSRLRFLLIRTGIFSCSCPFPTRTHYAEKNNQLSSLTADQLATIGPIPLASEDGVPHSPRGLLSLLLSLLEEKLNIRYRDHGGMTISAATSKDSRDGVGHESTDRPFSETSRWCLGALKNLTRPGKFAPSKIVVGDECIALSSENGTEQPPLATLVANGDTSAVAARAILDAGILPVLLRVLWYVDDDDGARYLPNTPFDQALSALMHLASVPQVRGALREDYGCVGVLTDIVVRGKETMGDVLLKSKDDTEVESMRQLCLQCLKAVSFTHTKIKSHRNEFPRAYEMHVPFFLAPVD